MAKRLAAGAALAFLAAACALNGSEEQVLSAGLSSEQMANSFRAAVVDVCVASAIGGTPVADLATETGPIVREGDPALAKLAQAKDGDTVWSSREAQGAVLVRANDRECQVSAYGPPALQTFELVAQSLSDPHGFVLDPQVKGSGASILQRYTKKAGDRTFHVTLSGSDASGTPSRSGALVATVTATPPAQG